MIRSILVLLVLALPASANDLFLSQLQLDQLGTVAAFDQGRKGRFTPHHVSNLKTLVGSKAPLASIISSIDLPVVRKVVDKRVPELIESEAGNGVFAELLEWFAAEFTLSGFDVVGETAEFL